MKSQTNYKPTARIAWLSDLHLDQATPVSALGFFKKLSGGDFDAAVISGDISNGQEIAGHLAQLGVACAPRPVYFCLGNHDYHSSDFDTVHDGVLEVCKRHDNVHFLGNEEIIRLTDSTALIGHGGWADGLAGLGRKTLVKSRDHHSIGDFSDLSRDELFDRMHQLGRESEGYFRRVMPYALSCFSNLVVCTHVPPFRQATQFSGKVCGDTHLPHFSNLSAGGVIAGIARNHPRRRITVVCGHTHCSTRVRILENLEVRVGGAQRGAPSIQGILDVN